MKFSKLFFPRYLVLLAPIILGIVGACFKCPANWDLLNYHIYTADAFTRNRLFNDLLATGNNSYVNPLTSLLFYKIVIHWNLGRLFGFLVGFIEGIVVPLTFWIASLTSPGFVKRYPWIVLGLVILGLFSPFTISEIGTDQGGALLAPLILAALGCFLCAFRGNTPRYSLLLFSGLLVGGACGLKLIFINYAVSLSCVVFCSAYLYQYDRKLRITLYACACFGGAIIAGYLIAGGWWQIYIWKNMGNPLFPYYSEYFKSPLLLPSKGQDLGLGHPQVYESLLMPFSQLFQPEHFLVNEHRVRWATLAATWILGIIALIIILVKKLTVRPQLISRSSVLDIESFISLLIFVLLSILIWAFLTPVARYLSALENILPLLLFYVMLLALEKKNLSDTKQLIGGGVLVLVLWSVPILTKEHSFSWWHTGWTNPEISVEVPTLKKPNRTLILPYRPSDELASLTVGWLVPSFPKEISIISVQADKISSRWAWDKMPISGNYYSHIKNLIRGTRPESYALLGPYEVAPHSEVELLKDDVDAAYNVFDEHGLYLRKQSCQDYQARFGTIKSLYAFCRVSLK